MLNAKGDATAFCALALKFSQSFTRFENTRLRIHVKDLYIESGHPRKVVNGFTDLLLHKYIIVQRPSDL